MLDLVIVHFFKVYLILWYSGVFLQMFIVESVQFLCTLYATAVFAL